jgi:hypothetical protein
VNRHSVAVCHNRKTNGAHSRQIFAGFSELAKSGAIDLALVEEDWNPGYATQNLIKVTLDGESDLLFDVNDGFYWIHDDLERNIEYFAERILPKFRCVFKRSCNSQMVARFGGAAAKFRPLGLNYDLTSGYNLIDRTYYGWRDQLKKRIKRSEVLCRALGKTPDRLFHFENFEHPPMPDRGTSPPQILLLTRLWDPAGENTSPVASSVRNMGATDRDSINQVRIECIEKCRRAFSGQFMGGLADNPYAKKVAPHLVVPNRMTDKRNFMTLVKASPICIATTGLHLSTGWRLGEYVAASRAIVSERIHDGLPGSFRAPDNYLEFSTADELLRALRELVADRSLMKSMMWNNYCYYRTYVRPDSLVLNALLNALQ